MSDRIKTMVVNQLHKRGIIDTTVLDAMSKVPRHRFVSRIYRSMAYTDNPLPIGHGQTISQPYVVALMTQLLKVDQKHKVLEIGTGCGYQTAILSILSKKVITIEVLSSLSTKSQNRLTKHEYNNIDFHCADGKNGWSKEAPYDRILVSAAPETIPEVLIEQLAPKGCMVIPVGSLYDQFIQIITKDKDEQIYIKKSTPVRFVPLV
jgi:protein-L-isoaspartate(D-aspartate) O-methyltransferase